MTTTTTTPATTVRTPATSAPSAPAATGASRRKVAAGAFWTLLLRDLTVLRKDLLGFTLRTVMQPFLLVFVFTYILPTIGGATDANDADFATLLVAGIVALSVVMQGMQAVAQPLTQELGLTREIEDRVLAPMPTIMIAVEKVASGTVHGLLAALLVFPLAALVPATPVNLDISWPLLIAVLPVVAIVSAAGGLAFGTMLEARTVPLVFSVIVLPLTFLGAIFFTWYSLQVIPWLKWAVLVNPVVYMSEGLRAALVIGSYHMAVVPIFAGLIVSGAAFFAIGLRGFQRRVQK